MNQATQQISSNPARDFANAVLAETDGAREIIHMLHDIAQGIHEDATEHDRLSASTILLDRGLGKCPKQSPATSPNPNPVPETDNNDVGAIRESPPATPRSEPESPRLVTQLDNSLHQSLGPAPEAHAESIQGDSSHDRHSDAEPAPYSIREENPISSEPFAPYSIQNYILEITNNCRTLITVLTDIYRAPDDRGVKQSHRVRAGRMLLDRVLGTNPALALSRVEAWPERSPAPDAAEAKPKVRYVDPEALAEARAEIQRMKDEGILTPDPNAPKLDLSRYFAVTDEEVAPYAKEEAAKFWAEVDLRLERQKQWPEIEERRRKKLAQIYPSHSDGKPPDP